MCLAVFGLRLLVVFFGGCEILDLEFSLVAVMLDFILLGFVVVVQGLGAVGFRFRFAGF